MDLLINKASDVTGTPVALEDLILTTSLPATGGSMMLDGYVSLFDAEVVGKLTHAGFGIVGKANVGEFGFDLLGETSHYGAVEDEAGNLATATSALLASGAVQAVVGLDVNGTQRRAAALAHHVCVKPTYGTVSRFGTIAVACAGETVCVSANTVDEAREVLSAIAGHDDKDGTSLPDGLCVAAGVAAEPKQKKIAVAAGFASAADEGVRAALESAVSAFKAQGFEVEEIDDALLQAARPAWNVLMSAELCNNVSRFDGVKYGHRASDYETIDDLYTNSRTEAFGEVLKTAILYGSEMLSEENYDKMYDKSLRVRRVIVEEFVRLFDTYDAVLLPACGKSAYTADDAAADKFLCFKENAATAPASITGLPAVVAGGVQLVGPAFSEGMLLTFAEKLQTAFEEVR